MIKINRRDFLKGSVAIGVAGAISGTVLNTLKPSKAHADETGTIAYTPTTCVGCTTWCAVEVKTQEIGGIKRAIDVRANQNSERSGNVCPRGKIAVQEVYDADRVKVPMRRTNLTKGRGVDPGFIPVSWGAALDEIAVKMNDMRNAGNSHKWAWLRGRYSYNRLTTYDVLKIIYGSPNAISHSAICAEAENVARSLCVGRHGYDDYDLDNCTYLITWGLDPISSNRMVAGAIERLGARQNLGMKVVAVDPRLNAIASKADKWLPVIPGTDGALALAMASHILSSGSWNKTFVGLGDTVFTPGSPAAVGSLTEKGTMGVVTWWNTVLTNCSPDASNFANTGKTVAQITGIDAATIKQVATDFATIGGETAISWMGPGVAMQPNGIYGAWAVIALNGLVGSLDHKGGVIQAEPSNSYYSDDKPTIAAAYTDAISATGATKAKLIHYVQKNAYDSNALAMPAVEYDSAAKTFGYQKISPTARLAKCIIDKSPYETKMLIGAMVNHPFSCVGANMFETALSGDMTGWSAVADDSAPPFVVDITTHASEFGMFADIILPGKHLGLECKASTHQRSGMYKIHSLYNECITPVWSEAKNAELEFPWLLAQAFDAVGFSKLIDYYRTTYPAAMGGATLNKTDAASLFEEYAWKYHATKKSDTAANRNSQFAAISAATYNPTGISSTVGAGNGISQATYASTYFDGSGRGTAWLAAVAGTGGWPTKSSKVEVHNPSSALQVFFNDYIKGATKFNTTVSAMLSACNYDRIAGLAATDEAQANMPNYEDPFINAASGYTLTFIDHKSRLNREGRSANTSWYNEFKSCDAGDEKWKDVIKMNPIDAAAAGIKDGDSVIVSSPSNTTGVKCIAKLWQGVRQGTVAKAYGQGHWAYGKYASTTFGSVANGGNNNEILNNQFERLSGSAARNANTKVKIVKA
jgi:anaerobic selenocysteine-containing dehydrogenase